MLEMASNNHALSGIANFASALSFELVRGPAPEMRDFVRVKFKNGTHDGEFQTVNIFGHREEMVPVTEFFYWLERHAISDERRWSSACSTSWFLFEVGASITSESTSMPVLFAIFSLFAFCLFALSAFVRHSLSKRTKQREVMTETEEHDPFINEKSRLLPM